MSVSGLIACVCVAALLDAPSGAQLPANEARQIAEHRRLGDPGRNVGGARSDEVIRSIYQHFSFYPLTDCDDNPSDPELNSGLRTQLTAFCSVFLPE